MSQVTREHVLDILAHAHLTPEQEQTVLALSYPADIEQVMAVFARYGITKDSLINRMGGSP
jgi:hypothetical protein